MPRPRPEVKPAKLPDRASGTWWRAALVVLAGFLVYSNSLSGPFVLDDDLSVVNNLAIHQLSNVGAVLLQRDTPVAGRPIVALSFAINYATSGLAVQAYHLTNIAIHAVCALLLFGIARRTLELPKFGDRYRGATGDLALAIALLWVVHPLATEAVDYVTERTESLMALFLLMTVYASIRSATSSRKAMWTSVAVLSCASGMGCKESMVVAPVIVLLYDRIFLFDSLRNTFATRWRLYGALATTWLLLAYLMLPGPRSNSVGFSQTIQPATYLLNQARMVARYLRLSVWPSGLVIFYGPPVSLHLRDVFPQAIFIVLLATATIVALARRPPLGFLGAWVFITLAPTSSVIPIATEVGAERRMYLPLMAITALLVVGAYGIGLFQRRFSRVAAMTVLAAVSISLAAATLMRNREYANELSLAESVLRRWPTDAAHGGVGSALARLGRDEEAIPELRLAARTDPRSRYNLGVALFNLKRFDEAIHELSGMADEHPMLAEVPSARQIIGHAFALQHNWPRAINQLTLSLSMIPGDRETRKLLVDVLNNQGLELVHAGNFDQAVPVFRRAATVDPQRVDARHNLAAALFDNREPEAAEQEARQAVVLNPGDANSYDLLGRALAVQGKMDDAVAQLQHALSLAPNDVEIRDDLQRVVSAAVNSKRETGK
jgi:Flp pilus assembly protein TadD